MNVINETAPDTLAIDYACTGQSDNIALQGLIDDFLGETSPYKSLSITVTGIMGVTWQGDCLIRVCIGAPRSFMPQVHLDFTGCTLPYIGLCGNADAVCSAIFDVRDNAVLTVTGINATSESSVVYAQGNCCVGIEFSEITFLGNTTHFNYAFVSHGTWLEIDGCEVKSYGNTFAVPVPTEDDLPKRFGCRENISIPPCSPGKLIITNSEISEYKNKTPNVLYAEIEEAPIAETEDFPIETALMTPIPLGIDGDVYIADIEGFGDAGSVALVTVPERIPTLNPQIIINGGDACELRILASIDEPTGETILHEETIPMEEGGDYHISYEKHIMRPRTLCLHKYDTGKCALTNIPTVIFPEMPSLVRAHRDLSFNEIIMIRGIANSVSAQALREGCVYAASAVQSGSGQNIFHRLLVNEIAYALREPLTAGCILAIDRPNKNSSPQIKPPNESATRGVAITETSSLANPPYPKRGELAGAWEYLGLSTGTNSGRVVLRKYTGEVTPSGIISAAPAENGRNGYGTELTIENSTIASNSMPIRLHYDGTYVESIENNTFVQYGETAGPADSLVNILGHVLSGTNAQEIQVYE